MRTKSKRKQTLAIATVAASFFVAFSSFAASSQCNELFLLSTSKLPSALRADFASLSPGGSIPDVDLQTFDSRILGRAIVNWVKDHEDSAELTEGAVPLDMDQSTQIMLHFNADTIDSIAENSYENIYERFPTSKAMSKSVRANAEDVVTGLQLSGANASPTALRVRPKSALLYIDVPFALAKWANGAAQYGDSVAVLKPAVKKRSIWTNADSLWLASLNPSVVSKRRGTFSRKTFPLEGAMNYPEVLVYGELGIADIDHFLVTKSESAEKLRKYGKAIFLTKYAALHDRQYRPYLQLLYKGTYSRRALTSEAKRLLGLDEKSMLPVIEKRYENL